MDCFLDFCLSCDKQTMSGLYCSQACRLADLEKACSSTPSSPYSPCAESSSRSYFPTGGFQLPAALSFKMSEPVESTCSHRALSPSSSRSSLSSSSLSTSSSHTNPFLSEQARSELQGYVSAFDQTREIKRRSLNSH